MSDVAVVQTIHSEKDKKIINKRSLFSWWKNAEVGSGQQEAWRKSKEGVYPCHGGGAWREAPKGHKDSAAASHWVNTQSEDTWLYFFFFFHLCSFTWTQHAKGPPLQGLHLRAELALLCMSDPTKQRRLAELTASQEGPWQPRAHKCKHVCVFVFGLGDLWRMHC